MHVFWSIKGGSGTSVVAAVFALDSPGPALLVDLAGDAPSVLGMAEPGGAGVAEWLASPTAAPAALHRLITPVTDGLDVLCQGGRPPVGCPTVRWAALSSTLVDDERHGAHAQVIVDAGTGVPHPGLLGDTVVSVLVLRPCYLSLRRASALPARPHAVVLVREAGRALGRRDVEHAVGAPVLAEVPHDPDVARAVDAGLLRSRPLRSITQPLRRLR